MLPTGGRPAGLPKCAWGWLSCALLQLACPVPAPQASWAGGKAPVRRGKGPHSLHQLPGMGPAWSLSGLCAGGDQLHDGAASSSMCEHLQHSALSSLLLRLSRFLQRQSCVLAPAALRCALKSQWPCHGAGLSIPKSSALLGVKSCSVPAPIPIFSLLLLPFLSPSPVCHSTNFLILVCTVL